MRLVEKSHINQWMLKPCTQHDRQCTYNVTLRCVRATTVAVEKQLVLRNLSLCICCLCYPARNAQEPYFNLWLVPVYNIFPNCVINGTIFEKLLLNSKRVFCVSLHHLCQRFLILRINERNMIKNVHWPSCSVTLILVRFW